MCPEHLLINRRILVLKKTDSIHARNAFLRYGVSMWRRMIHAAERWTRREAMVFHALNPCRSKRRREVRPNDTSARRSTAVLRCHSHHSSTAALNVTLLPCHLLAWEHHHIYHRTLRATVALQCRKIISSNSSSGGFVCFRLNSTTQGVPIPKTRTAPPRQPIRSSSPHSHLPFL